MSTLRTLLLKVEYTTLLESGDHTGSASRPSPNVRREGRFVPVSSSQRLQFSQSSFSVFLMATAAWRSSGASRICAYSCGSPTLPKRVPSRPYQTIWLLGGEPEWYNSTPLSDTENAAPPPSIASPGCGFTKKRSRRTVTLSATWAGSPVTRPRLRLTL